MLCVYVFFFPPPPLQPGLYLGILFFEPGYMDPLDPKNPTIFYRFYHF